MPHAQLPSLPPRRQPRWLLVLMFIAHATPLSIATVIFLQTMFPDAGLFFQALMVALIIATVVVAVGRLAQSVTSAKPVVSKWPRKMGWITWTFTMSVACVVTSAVCASSSPDGEYEYASVAASAVAFTYSVALLVYGKQGAAWVSLGGLLTQGGATLAAYVLMPTSKLEALWSASFLGGSWSFVGSSTSAVYLRMLAGCQIFGGGLHAVQPVGLRTRLGVAAVWFSTVATACAVGAWRLDRSEPLLFLPWCTAPFISGIFVVLAATHGCRSHTERPVASQSLRDV